MAEAVAVLNRIPRASTQAFPWRIMTGGSRTGLAMSLEGLAKRYVWWVPPDEVLADPPVLIRQVLRLGRPEDYAEILDAYGRPGIVAALRSAPPGAIDDRSWHFWHLVFGLEPGEPPRRSFG